MHRKGAVRKFTRTFRIRAYVSLYYINIRSVLNYMIRNITCPMIMIIIIIITRRRVLLIRLQVTHAILVLDTRVSTRHNIIIVFYLCIRFIRYRRPLTIWIVFSLQCLLLADGLYMYKINVTPPHAYSMMAEMIKNYRFLHSIPNFS